jgi:PelA/Pel-15E family pectate lyase
MAASRNGSAERRCGFDAPDDGARGLALRATRRTFSVTRTTLSSAAKAMDSTHKRNEDTSGPWGRRGMSMKAAVNEIRYLVRAHRLTGENHFLKTARQGFDFLLRAQYPNGGWPHSFPHFRTRYDRYATFNDDEMIDIMRLLREVATEEEFDPLGPERRAAAQSAFDKGVDFILNSQVVVDGRPTVWAQQHDETTFEPRAARSFEPVALSAGESAGVLALLMSIPNPSPPLVRAIQGAAAWYAAVKIEGLRVERTADDCFVRDDPSAPPIWARFYQIRTNRPIFAGRDGIVRFKLADIERERRIGYTWYGTWGTTVLEQFAIWKRLVGQAGSVT